MDDLLRDIRYGLRTLLRAPGFTLAAVLALGLGIGATTAIFSVLDGVVLRPLPYAQPDRLVMIRETNHAKALEHEPLSPVNFLDYRGLRQVFADAAAWWRPDVNLTDEQNEPIRARTIEVSANFFSVLGVQPHIGRGFPAGPLHARDREVVISHRLWRNRFRGDRGLIGEAIRLNGQPNIVVGVMPPGFEFPRDTDIWQRLNWDLSQHSRAAHFMEAVGRLQPRVAVEQANDELESLTRRLRSEFTGTNAGWGARVAALHSEVVGFFQPALYVLLGAVALLLLIACINVANLLLARATAREREVAIRAAIGASRTRLVRQLLTESLTLAALGSAAGLLVAFAGVQTLVAASPIEIPRLDQVGLDGRVLGFATLVGLLTAVVFGLAPALLMSGPDLQQVLKEGGRGFSGGLAGRKARSALVVAEVALAVVLMIGAGLLTRSFAELVAEEPGFDPSQVLAVNLQVSGEDFTQVERFYSSLLESLRAHSASVSVGATNFLPLAPGWRIPFLVQGRPRPKSGDEATAQHHSVDEGYFRTLGIPLVRGRFFDPRDTADAPGVVLINETLARQQWPDEDPIGKRIVSFARQIGPLGRRLVDNPSHEIVGIVRDSKNNSLRAAPEPAIYHPQRQFPFRNMNLVLRGRGETVELAAIVRDAVRRLDPRLPVSDIRPMDRVVGEAIEQPRFLMFLMAGFAGLALVLAALGIYGVLSYAVGQRRQEIGIRMALGADAGSVLWLIVRQGFGLAAAGALLGAAGGYALGRMLSSLLYGVTPGDGLTFGGALAVVLAVAVVACVIPARRASTLDPLAGLRAE